VKGSRSGTFVKQGVSQGFARIVLGRLIVKISQPPSSMAEEPHIATPTPSRQATKRRAIRDSGDPAFHPVWADEWDAASLQLIKDWRLFVRTRSGRLEGK